jgi:uncharacterized protein YndB with AHSA1/START domain/uncharacterized protein YciI
MTTLDKNSPARAIADVNSGTILANVEIAASPERVFRALTTPEEIVRWWGSDALYRTKEWVQDFRVGGRWQAKGLGSDGVPFTVEGEFLEISPPHTLVQSWKPEWDGGHTSRLTYRLEAVGGGTRVTVRHEGFGDRHESCASHAEGWHAVLDWLADFAAPAAEAKFFVCRLLAPRPSFAFDMNEAERAIMQEHAGYWTTMLAAGTAVIFGPVADPKGPWGLGIVKAKDEAAVRAIEAADPAIRSKRGFSYEILPMIQAVVRG